MSTVSGSTDPGSVETPVEVVSDSEVIQRLPRSWVDHDNIEFFRGLLQRRLLLNRCQDCATWYHVPWPGCPRCWSEDVRPTEVSGRGVIHSMTTSLLAPAPGRDEPEEHCVALVELEEQEGLRVALTVVGRSSDDDVRIGSAVQLTWIERDGEPLPAVQPISRGVR